MKLLQLSLLIFSLLMTPFAASITFAQEGSQSDDNACFSGGVMEGKCDTDWEWMCGYYLARWQANCISLLPPRFITPPGGDDEVFPSAGCLLLAFGGGQPLYANFNGSYFFTVPAPGYSDPDCTIPNGGFWVDHNVYAPAPYDAETLCLEAFGTTLFLPFPWGYDPNVWACY